jgi:hypothetical protein
MPYRFGRASGLAQSVFVFALLLAACGRAATLADNGDDKRASHSLAETALVIATADGRRHRYGVEVARTPDEQARGLMYRRAMPPDRGMLFPFRPARPASFWMANTYIPLDMIFIAPGGRIESILADVPPLTEDQRRSLGPVVAVLELNAGETARIGARPGDRVEYDLGGLPAVAN